jgi:hypothetical protein
MSSAADKRKPKRPAGLSIVPPPRSRSLKPVAQLQGPRKEDGAPPKLLSPPDATARKRTRSNPSTAAAKGDCLEIFSPPPKRGAPSEELPADLQLVVPAHSDSSPDSTPSTATLVSEARTPMVEELPLMLPMKARLRNSRPSSIDGDMFRALRREEPRIAIY